MQQEGTFRKEIRAIFNKTQDDGGLTLEELKGHLNDEKTRLRLKALGLDVSEAHGLFRLLDTDDQGELDCDEFAIGCLRLRGQAKSLDTATLMYENKKMMKTW